ncbi:hypothetical protein K432DRAFT_404673 [Lepidopterella palustris CBS 459.81]|uniref:Uncharacterized protein n=1 Tax=Lepidopterella palustris CBS 459.81 TaxID=1314670 RepID=A0A8E2EAN1_9PEZI|nr:hypothetical protein K432DRAFT_404673 [Lepidopterella palustris CBS 459.81]
MKSTVILAVLGATLATFASSLPLYLLPGPPIESLDHPHKPLQVHKSTVVVPSERVSSEAPIAMPRGVEGVAGLTRHYVYEPIRILPSRLTNGAHAHDLLSEDEEVQIPHFLSYPWGRVEEYEPAVDDGSIT